MLEGLVVQLIRKSVDVRSGRLGLVLSNSVIQMIDLACNVINLSFNVSDEDPLEPLGQMRPRVNLDRSYLDEGDRP